MKALLLAFVLVACAKKSSADTSCSKTLIAVEQIYTQGLAPIEVDASIVPYFSLLAKEPGARILGSRSYTDVGRVFVELCDPVDYFGLPRRLAEATHSSVPQVRGAHRSWGDAAATLAVDRVVEFAGDDLLQASVFAKALVAQGASVVKQMPMAIEPRAMATDLLRDAQGRRVGLLFMAHADPETVAAAAKASQTKIVASWPCEQVPPDLLAIAGWPELSCSR